MCAIMYACMYVCIYVCMYVPTFSPFFLPYFPLHSTMHNVIMVVEKINQHFLLQDWFVCFMTSEAHKGNISLLFYLKTVVFLL